MNDKLIDRLFQRFDAARNGYAGEGAYKDGLRAAVDELAKTNVEDAVPTFLEAEFAAHKDWNPNAEMGLLAASGRVANLFRGRVIPVIVSLRAENDALREHVATLEAQNAKLTGKFMAIASRATADQLAPIVGPHMIDIRKRANALAEATMLDSTTANLRGDK